VQRLPDQTRRFFQARGFDTQQADVIARRCVFQTVFPNTSAPETGGDVEYNLRDWSVQAGGKRQGMKTREDWRSVWASKNTPQPAQLAFEWALFPTQQIYRPGDYNWGMSVFNLPPGSAFDLHVVWRWQGKTRSARIAVNVGEDEDTVFGFAGQTPITFPLPLDTDGRVIRKYPVTGLPTTLFQHPPCVGIMPAPRRAATGLSASFRQDHLARTYNCLLFEPAIFRSSVTNRSVLALTRSDSFLKP
jgi:hypothetical protein